MKNFLYCWDFDQQSYLLFLYAIAPSNSTDQLNKTLLSSSGEEVATSLSFYQPFSDFDAKFFECFGFPIPGSSGSVAVGPKVYVSGGKHYPNGPPLSRLYVLESSIEDWVSGPPMLAPRVHPMVIVCQRRVYAFGHAPRLPFSLKFAHPLYYTALDCDPWAEFFDVDDEMWYPLHDLPNQLLNAHFYGHVVVRDCIMLWTDTHILFYNPNPTSSKQNWTVVSLAPAYLILSSTKATVMDGVFYWLCGPLVFAYDLIGNTPFSDPLFEIATEDIRQFTLCTYMSSTQNHIFATNKHELCLIWLHFYDKEQHISGIVCGKVRVEKSKTPEGKISLHATNPQFEYFNIAHYGTMSVDHSFGLVNQCYDESLLLDPESVLGKLSSTIQSEIIREQKRLRVAKQEYVTGRVSLSETKSIINSVSSIQEPQQEDGTLLDTVLQSARASKYFDLVTAHLEQHKETCQSALELVSVERLMDLGIPMGPASRIFSGCKVLGNPRLILSSNQWLLF